MTTDSVSITDTGKRRTTSVSAEETDKANSGSAIALHGVELTVMDAATLNTTPAVGKLSTATDATTKWAYAEVDTLGMDQPKWTARGLLDVNSSSDMAVVKALRDLPRTKGYKTISGDLPDWSDGSNNSSTINVHISSVKIIHTSNSNLIEYTIEMFETA